MLLVYAGALWAGARIANEWSRLRPELVRTIGVVSIALAVLSFFDAVGLSPFGASGHGERTGSVLGNATNHGLVAAMLLLVLVPVALEDRNVFAWVAIGGSVLTVALSASRMSMLIVLAGVVVLGALRRGVALPLLGAIVGLVVTALAVPATRDRLLSGETVAGRWLQWRLSGRLIADHPLLGIGPSRYVDAFGAYETQAWVDFTGIHTYADSPHNIVLQIWSAGGIILVLVGATLAVLALRSGLAAARRSALSLGLLLAVTAYGAGLLVNFTAAGPTCLAAFLVGALIAERVPEAREQRWLRPVVTTVAGVLVAVLGVACISEIMLQRGMQGIADGDLSTAEAHFDTAQRLRPLDGDVAMLAAQALARPASHGISDAAPMADTAARASLRRTPDTYVSRLALGVSLIAQNRAGAAVTELDRLVDAFPMRPDGYVQRAIGRVGLGDLAGAQADLQHATEIAPHYRLATRILRQVDRLVRSSGAP